MMKPFFRRRRGLTLAVLGAALSGAAGLAQQVQGNAGQPFKLVVAQTAGAGSDVVARLLADRLGAPLGQPVVVENRPGAAGLIAHHYALEMPHDGQTLLMSSTSNLLVVPVMAASAKFRVADFAPVSPPWASSYVVVVANAPEEPSDLQGLLALARGRSVNYASAGVGSMGHLGAELLLARANGTQRHVHVAYRGSAQALTDVAGKQVVFAVDTLLAALPLIQSGRLRALAVTGLQRVSSLPDVPTLTEAGLHGLEISTKAGVFVPADTPAPVRATLSAAMTRVLAEPEIRARLETLGSEVLSLSPEQFAATLAREAPTWEALVRKLDLRLE